MLSAVVSLPVANTCTSPVECEAVVSRTLQSYDRCFPARPSKWRACTPHVVAHGMHAVQHLRNASALANAFIAGCTGTTWSAHDADGYFNATWRPGSQVGGAECASMTRFGPPWVPCAVREKPIHNPKDNPKVDCVAHTSRSEARYAQIGDGGKTLCDAEALLSPPGCLVVSVGINANTEFEEALHGAHPGCRIVAYDGTLDAAKRARAAARAPFLELHERNFGAALAANYSAISVRLLKIDCDGCEFKALPPWVSNVCTDQIVVEVHRTLRWRPYTRVRMIHNLMVQLDPLYRIFYLETNPAYPWLNTEYSFVRRQPCPRHGPYRVRTATDAFRS